SIAAKTARSNLGLINLPHPPSSPNLNPIEPLWLLLKNRVANIHGSFNSLDALWSAVQRVWDDISLREIQKHTGRMDNCVEAVLKAKGYHTQF
ncbi:hypothetical protein BDN70DRAFT_818125, partial [Pholiota conissans]